MLFGSFERIDTLSKSFISLSHSSFRWGHYPIDEAQTFGHTQVVEYMKKYEEELEEQQKAQREEEEKKNKESKAQAANIPI